MQFILDRQRYSRDNTHDYSFGIDRLLDDETYIAAYPLHDGEITTKGSRRHLLYTKWASLKVFDCRRAGETNFKTFAIAEILAVATAGLHQRLFRRQDWNLLRLAGLLHVHADPGFHRRRLQLRLLSEVDAEQRHQPADLPQQRHHHHVPVVRS